MLSSSSPPATLFSPPPALIFTSTDGATSISAIYRDRQHNWGHLQGQPLICTSGENLEFQPTASAGTNIWALISTPVGPIVPRRYRHRQTLAPHPSTFGGYRNRNKNFLLRISHAPRLRRQYFFLAADLDGEFLTSATAGAGRPSSAQPHFGYPPWRRVLNGSFCLPANLTINLDYRQQGRDDLSVGHVMDAVHPTCRHTRNRRLAEKHQLRLGERGESVTRTIGIINTWTGSFSASVQLTGTNTADYPITGGTCAAGSPGPEESCTIEVAFRPTAAFRSARS